MPYRVVVDNFHTKKILCSRLSALSRITPPPRVRVRVSVSIVLGLYSEGYSWIMDMARLSSSEVRF